MDNISDSITILKWIASILKWIWRGLKSFRKTLYRRHYALKKAGICSIYTSHEDIVTYRQEESIAQYISAKTNDSFVYIGVWLAEDKDNKEIGKAIKNLIDKGHSVSLYFRNPNIKGYENWFEKQYSENDVRKRIETCIRYWMEFRKELEPNNKTLLKLYVHQENISFSLFLFDLPIQGPSNNIPKKGRIFFDQKLYRFPKSESISMELRNIKSSKLFRKMLHVASEIAIGSKSIPEDMEENTTLFDDIVNPPKKKIKKNMDNNKKKRHQMHKNRR